MFNKLWTSLSRLLKNIMELIIVIAFKQKLHLNFYHLYNSICVLSKMSTKTIYILRCNWHLSHFSCSVVSDSLQPHGFQDASFPVHHPVPELARTHVHQVSGAIQPSHPLSSPSPPALNLSQHQGLFKWVGSSHQVAKVLQFQLQHHSFQWIFRTDLL